MKGTDFDYVADCRACANGVPEKYDTCPACGDGRHSHDDNGSGDVNRLQAAKDGHVRIDERVSRHGYVLIEETPVRDEETGGLEGRYGTWVPDDVDSGPMADYEEDTRLALKNELSEATEVSAHGNTITGEDIPGNGCDCDGTDPCPGCVESWARARGDDNFADVIAQLRSEM